MIKRIEAISNVVTRDCERGTTEACRLPAGRQGYAGFTTRDSYGAQ